MLVSILVHSKTGNTVSVSQNIKGELEKQGFTVTLEQIIAENDNEKAANLIRLTSSPRIRKADLYILAAPVRGAFLSPVMKAYLGNTNFPKNSRFYLFVTQSFPYKWMGGNRAIAQFIQLCKDKGSILKTGMINWSGKKKRQAQIDELVSDFSQV